MTDNCTLGDLLTLDLHVFGADVRQIVEQASKEVQIENHLEKLQQVWERKRFEFGEVRGVCYLKSTDSVSETLEDSQMNLQAMSVSKYSVFFQEEISSWISKFALVESVISIWNDVQRAWSSLRTIFSLSKDIRSQLPKETKTFDNVDSEWKELMSSAHEEAQVLLACTTALQHQLDTMKAALDVCQLALAEYVETKRKIFSRFYFISYLDILDILSHGNCPTAVMAHLPKLFDNIKHLMFAPLDVETDMSPQKVLKDCVQLNVDELAAKYSTDAIGMYSKEGEFMSFDDGLCACVGVVETWLLRLVSTMQGVVKQKIATAIQTFLQHDLGRTGWLQEHAAQPVLVANQVCTCFALYYCVSARSILVLKLKLHCSYWTVVMTMLQQICWTSTSKGYLN